MKLSISHLSAVGDLDISSNHVAFEVIFLTDLILWSFTAQHSWVIPFTWGKTFSYLSVQSEKPFSGVLYQFDKELVEKVYSLFSALDKFEPIRSETTLSEMRNWAFLGAAQIFKKMREDRNQKAISKYDPKKAILQDFLAVQTQSQDEALKKVFRKNRSRNQPPAHESSPLIATSATVESGIILPLYEPCPAIASLNVRLAVIQKKVDEAFSNLARRSGWAITNGERGFYNLMSMRDANIIREIASRRNGKNDVYFLDLGSGLGAWGDAVVDLLQREFFRSTKHFHVISITGDSVHRMSKSAGNISQYNLTRSKIENMRYELRKLSLHLESKVDLIVSNWTLRHLVDPLGTLTQAYSL